MGEPNSETFIELIEQHGDISRYRLRPVTGKKHQLRLHMAALGVPILNDKSYPELQSERGDDFTAPLQLLAKTIAFEDPFSGERRFFQSDRDLEL